MPTSSQLAGRGKNAFLQVVERVEIGECRVDPGHRRQRAGRGVAQEAGKLLVDGEVKNGLPRQAVLAEVAEPAVVSEQVVGVGQPQRPRIEGVPAPGLPPAALPG